MALSKENLKLMLDKDETEYTEIAKLLSKDNIEHLNEFAKSRDLMLAQKAIYAASLMNDDSGLSVLETAAKSSVAVKKIAAASALGNLKSGSAKNKLSEQLIRSNDVSVQKLVLKSVNDRDNVSIRFKSDVEALSKTRGSKAIQDLSKVALKKLK